MAVLDCRLWVFLGTSSKVTVQLQFRITAVELCLTKVLHPICTCLCVSYQFLTLMVLLAMECYPEIPAADALERLLANQFVVPPLDDADAARE